MSEGNRLPQDELDRAIEARSVEIRARQLELPAEKLLEMFRLPADELRRRIEAVEREVGRHLS